MTLRRRTLFSLGLAGAAAAGVSALGIGQALADPQAGSAHPFQGTAPADPFAVGVREYQWSRGDRRLTTRIFYPATGAAGGGPVRDAPLADGVYPVCEFSHGLNGSPESYGDLIVPLAAAGFIVPARSSRPRRRARRGTSGTSTTATSRRTSPRSSPARSR